MKRRGWFRIGRVVGVDAFLHWTMILALALGLYARSLEFLVGYLGVILAHALGHLVAIRWAGLRVGRIEIHAAGGELRAAGGTRTRMQAIGFAWSGVLAQLVLAAGTLLVLGAGVTLPETLVRTLVDLNLVGVVTNLLPVGRLDGVDAWRIVPYLVSSMRRTRVLDKRLRKDLTLKSAPPGPYGRMRVQSQSDLVIDDAEAEELAERLRSERETEQHP